MDAEIVKMSAKGQLVVPQGIREMEGLNEGDRFVPLPVKEGVLFKKIKIPNVKVEFENLAKEVEERFKKQGISEKEAAEAVKWARKR